MTLAAATLCSGIGAPETAMPEWRWLWCAEREPFPAAVLAARFGHPNLGDVTAEDFVERAIALGIPNVIVAGTPCFAGDHMVLTENGYVPISDVAVGDQVVTHTGRLRAVKRIGSKISKTGMIVGVGLPGGIRCTPEHQFLSRNWRSQNTRRNGKYAKIETCGQPEWTAARRMVGRQWISLTKFFASPEDSGHGPRVSTRTAMRLAGF